ncbi:hypothetical protein V9T40_001303 [Parthenolecanium corni]|uniref:Uncharacterized protein n=1 Tax=Parthenolecanium corni TaxID=536013 RepID=A0AAN9TEQ2_9HEMI
MYVHGIRANNTKQFAFSLMSKSFITEHDLIWAQNAKRKFSARFSPSIPMARFQFAQSSTLSLFLYSPAATSSSSSSPIMYHSIQRVSTVTPSQPPTSVHPIKAKDIRQGNTIYANARHYSEGGKEAQEMDFSGVARDMPPPQWNF